MTGAPMSFIIKRVVGDPSGWLLTFCTLLEAGRSEIEGRGRCTRIMISHGFRQRGSFVYFMALMPRRLRAR